MKRLNKKADLSLSTNAIVVLIIAITVLGLALGFTRGAFNSLMDKIRGIDTETKIPNPADFENPIKLSPQSVDNAKRGAVIKETVNIFNRFDTDTANTALVMKCIDQSDSEEHLLPRSGSEYPLTFMPPGPKNIPMMTQKEFSTTITISKTAKGVYACTITAQSENTDTSGKIMEESKDLTITIAE